VWTQEIPRESWSTFLDSFSRQHYGWRATIEIIDQEIGAGVEGQDMLLVGISADFKNNESAISVILGEGADQQLTRIIAEPAHLMWNQTEPDLDDVLAIQSAAGVTTLVYLRSVKPSEMLPGDTE